jgi:hypothetical protein
MRKLSTEAAGRALAIRMLLEGERLGCDETCLYEYDLREGPQNNFTLRYLKRLRKADNEEVYRGFASVLSDVCATLDEGAPGAQYYEGKEKEAISLRDPSFRQFIARATGA